MELDFLSVVETLKALSLGGISLAILVVILTEVIKEFAGLEGKAVRAVALGLGFALTAIAYGMAEGLIPASAAPYIEWAFVAIVGGLGGIGLWHLGQRFLSTGIGGQLPEDMLLAAGYVPIVASQALVEPGKLTIGPDDPGIYFHAQDPTASISLGDGSTTVTAAPVDIQDTRP